MLNFSKTLFVFEFTFPKTRETSVLVQEEIFTWQAMVRARATRKEATMMARVDLMRAGSEKVKSISRRERTYAAGKNIS